METIGFKPPVNPDKTWKTEINGKTYTFIKKKEKEGVFTYSCGLMGENGRSWTGYYSPRDLSPEEVERSPQFDRFIGR